MVSSSNFLFFKSIVQLIAKHALTILINISSDTEVLKALAEDDHFLESVLLRVTVSRRSRFKLFALRFP